MKRMSGMVIAIALMLAPVSMVMAGGDQNRGDTGIGETHENACENQPCFATAPQPGTAETLISNAPEATAVLQQSEIDHLLFIREEEKLARDVYRVLYAEWGNLVFANIAESEQAHMDAMANLLDFYGVDDPVTSDETGAFTSDSVRDLFEELTERGSISNAEALLVGGFIEEYDILDIWAASDATDEERIKRVYQNLYEGSYNHLDAFVHNYESLTGGVYTTQLLTGDQYEYVTTFVTQARQAQEPKRK
jgi:hypothetical protein